MKRLSFLLSFLLAVMLITTSAFADPILDLLASSGLSDADAEAFKAIVEEMGDDLTEDQIKALMTEFLEAFTSQEEQGKVENDTFTHPDGFSFKIPEGWTVREDSMGVSAFLVGPVNEQGITPTISVTVLGESQPDFDTMKQEDWDAVLGTTLKNYQFVALDDFVFLDVPAHEFVCTHGDDLEAMLMQYQLYFNKNNKAYIITMTTLAEEAAHENALESYDMLLSDFTVQNDPGIG